MAGKSDYLQSIRFLANGNLSRQNILDSCAYKNIISVTEEFLLVASQKSGSKVVSQRCILSMPQEICDFLSLRELSRYCSDENVN